MNRQISKLLILCLVLLSGCDKTVKQKESGSDGSNMSSEYFTMDDFNTAKKIDVHVHINSEGKNLINEARSNNFQILSMAVDVAGHYPPIDEQLRVRIKHHQENPRVMAFATAFTLEGWDEPDWSDKVIQQLTIDFDNGALGVKVWKNIGMVERNTAGNLIMLDDPKFDPIFKFIKDKNKVLLSHAGEPKNCWLPIDEMTVKNDQNYFSKNPEFHMYKHPEMPSYQDQITARNNMLAKNSELTFVAVHLASLEWSVDEIGKFLDQYPNASVDLAERISHLQAQSMADREKVHNFIVKYQNRIVYG
ncbi:MAG: amidohydrolase family protein, partial [Cyclobacteriaceae bacterium]|nr:amidohydrolase family protein [Cyclobacteriaceae bacterium]